MGKVRAKRDVYVGGSYHYKTEVFDYDGPEDNNLEPVPEDTPLGLPETKRVESDPRPSIAGTPTPQVVFDFDEGSVDDTPPEKPTNLDLFA